MPQNAYMQTEQKIIYIFQNVQKIVQTLLKWMFWTSINLNIIKNKKQQQHYFSLRYCIYGPLWAFYPVLGCLFPRVG